MAFPLQYLQYKDEKIVWASTNPCTQISSGVQKITQDSGLGSQKLHCLTASFSINFFSDFKYDVKIYENDVHLCILFIEHNERFHSIN
jgi:hypothetical protein